MKRIELDGRNFLHFLIFTPIYKMTDKMMPLNVSMISRLSTYLDSFSTTTIFKAFHNFTHGELN